MASTLPAPTLHAAPGVGPNRYPLVGHLPAFLKDKLDFLRRCVADHANCEGAVPLEIAGPTWLLLEPSDIEHVLVSNAANYDKSKRMTSRRGRRISGSGMLTASGAEHLRKRRLLQPLFNRSHRSQRGVIEQSSDIIVDAARARLDRWSDGATIDITREMEDLTQQIIVDLVFGRGFWACQPDFRRALGLRRRFFEITFQSLLPFPEALPTPFMRTYRRAHRCLENVIFQQIRQARSREASDSPVESLLHRMVRAQDPAGQCMTDRELFDELLTLCVTGYETLGVALNWTWVLLAQHPDWQERLVEEASAPHPAASQMHCARKVLSESMRLYPPTWLYVRMARNTDTLPSGARIRAGDKLYLSQYAMHRNPRWFPDPERFDPERFTKNAEQQRPPFAYFPFGGGPRVCMGQNLAWLEGILILGEFSQRLRFELLPGQSITPVPTITLRPAAGITMRLRSRP